MVSKGFGANSPAVAAMQSMKDFAARASGDQAATNFQTQAQDANFKGRSERMGMLDQSISRDNQNRIAAADVMNNGRNQTASALAAFAGTPGGYAGKGSRVNPWLQEKAKPQLAFFGG